MKKFLTGAIILILLFYLLDTAYYRWGIYINLGSEEVSTFTDVKGKEILIDKGEGLKPYEIKGVDLGAGIPGHFATEYAIDKDTYLRWFKLIQEMGANTIRVYTILSPSFYEAVYEYNSENENPLYVLHGVWVNDYILNSHVDAYDDDFFEKFKEDSRTLVDVLHGRKKVNLGYSTSTASGSFTKDISSWVIGYILGVEWEDVTVAFTDHMHKSRNVYKGKYMYTSNEATAFEALLAEAGDNIIRYETDKYHEQRLVAFANWPTTDPLDYPDAINKMFLKSAKVDVEHIKTTDKFRSGQFASYHVYSYYPDYLQYFDDWKNEVTDLDKYKLEDGKINTYGAYLEILAAHHSMPVVISEFGVPTSRGRAQLDYNTARSQGYMSESEQGDALVESYRDIINAGCAGSIIFTWQDEWFKRTWNTMANVDLTKTAFWSDFQTNEQFFGLMSFDPGEEKSVCYTDGDVSEWSESDLISEDEAYQLYMKYDEKFVYLRVHAKRLDFGNRKIYIPIDVTPKSGSYYVEGEDVRFDRQADFLIILDGKKNSRMLAQSRYDVFRAVFSEDYNEENPYFNPPDKNSPQFNRIYLGLQLANVNSVFEEERVSEKFETGHLTYGNGNPYSEDYESISDFIVQGNEIEIRLPWQLLNFSNPSEMKIHDDYYEKYGVENIGIKELYAGIGDEENKDSRIELGRLALEGWGRNPTSHERLKQSYYVMKELWASD